MTDIPFKERETGIFRQSDKNDLFSAAAETLAEYPEESFCFLNEENLRDRVSLIKKHFLPEDEFKGVRRIIYAMKANPKFRILHILDEAGIDGFDCASINELMTAKTHAPDKEAYMNNPIKKGRDIAEARKLGVTYFTAQSRTEIEKILRNVSVSGDAPVEISVRVKTPNPDAKINLSEKFGATEDEAREFIEYLKQTVKACRVAISMHTGSQNMNADTFKGEIRKISELAKSAGGVHSVNIGGGIPVITDDDISRDIARYLGTISEALRHNIKGALLDSENPSIIIEPGRSIIADSVDLVIPVLSSEKRGERRLVYIDDGLFTSFSDAAVHGWKYPIRPFPGPGKKSFSQNLAPFVLYGRTCDSGDHLKYEYLLPDDMSEGDYLHIPCSGAYMDSQSSVFNGFEPPKYVSYNL